MNVADTVDFEVLRHAHVFLQSLPEGTPLPDASVEADGMLDLEWYRDSRHLLSASVAADGTLYWAALVGDSGPRGRCVLNRRGSCPRELFEVMQKIGLIADVEAYR